MTQVVHCGRQPFDVFIGRPSMWGNPYRMKGEGDRARVIALYIGWLLMQPRLLARVKDLQGKKLGCYCAPKACHGHVLALLADGVPPSCLDLFI